MKKKTKRCNLDQFNLESFEKLCESLDISWGEQAYLSKKTIYGRTLVPVNIRLWYCGEVGSTLASYCEWPQIN